MDNIAQLQIKARGMVMQQYQLRDIYSPTVYSEVKAGKTMNVPVIQAEEAENFDDAGGAFSDAATAQVGVDIDLESPIKWRKKVPLSQEEDVPDIDFPQQYAAMGGRAIARGVGVRLINRAAGAVGVTVVQADFSVDATLPATMKVVGRKVAAYLGTQDLAEDVYGFLHPDIAYGWWEPLGLFDRNSGGDGSLKDSAIAKPINLYGINWQSSALGFKTDYTANVKLLAEYRVNNTKLVGVVWHKFAMGLRKTTAGPVTKLREAPEDDYVWSRSRLRIGTKAVQVAGIVLIKQNP